MLSIFTKRVNNDGEMQAYVRSINGETIGCYVNGVEKTALYLDW